MGWYAVRAPRSIRCTGKAVPSGAAPSQVAARGVAQDVVALDRSGIRWDRHHLDARQQRPDDGDDGLAGRRGVDGDPLEAAEAGGDG